MMILTAFSTTEAAMSVPAMFDLSLVSVRFEVLTAIFFSSS